MSCTDEQIVALLSDYHAGVLDASQRAAVKSHLADCADCRATLQLMGKLTRQDQPQSYGAGGGHIPAGVLARYYSQRSALNETEIGSIESHLQNCEACAGELRFLQELESDLEDSVDGSFGGPETLTVRPPANANYMGRTIAALALAATLVLAIVGFDRMKEPTVPRLDFNQHQYSYLVTPRRSATTMSAVHRASDNAIAAIALLHSHNTAQTNYRFVIRDRAESPLTHVRITQDMQRPDTVRLLVDTRGLPDGAYRLEMIEYDLSAPSDSVMVQYLFQLETDK